MMELPTPIPRPDQELSARALEGRNKARKILQDLSAALADPSTSWATSLEQRIPVPVDDHPDFNFLGLLLGPRGSQQKRMEELSGGARIVIRGRGSSKDGNDEDPHTPMYVLVSGDTSNQVEKASEMVRELLHNPDARAMVKSQQLAALQNPNQSRSLVLNEGLYSSDDVYIRRGGEGTVSELFDVPSDRVGHLVGRGGDTIRRVQSISGAFAQINKDESDEAGFKQIFIEGRPEEVEAAKAEFKRLLDEFETRRRENLGIGANHEIEVIQIPSDTVGLLIGKAGQTIKELAMRSQAKIQVARDSESGNGDVTRSVTIAGPRENIEAAKAQIDHLIRTQSHSHQLEFSNVSGADIRSVEVYVANDNVGMLIGRGGETIKSLMMRTGAKVEVCQEETGDKRLITVSGVSQSIDLAIAEIENIVGLEQKEMPNNDPYDAAAYYQAQQQGGEAPQQVPLSQEQIEQYAAYYGVDPQAYAEYVRQYYASGSV